MRGEDGFTPEFEATDSGRDQKGPVPAWRATCHVAEAARRTRAPGSVLCSGLVAARKAAAGKCLPGQTVGVAARCAWVSTRLAAMV